MKPTRILISNDDGISAHGIEALCDVMSEFGETWVVAPDRDRSATSHSMSLHEPIRVEKIGLRRYAVSGTPTDCVYLAMHHIMPHKPDLVVSGINHGANLGCDVIYSGTIAAAMEGAILGTKALALSLVLPGSSSMLQDLSREDFTVAAAVAQHLVRVLLKEDQPKGVLLNVNIPWLPAAERPKGFKVCRLGYSNWSHSVVKRQDPRGKAYFWIGGERQGHDDFADSDNLAVQSGYTSLTPVHFDLTHATSFEHFQKIIPVVHQKESPAACSREDLNLPPLTLSGEIST